MKMVLPIMPPVVTDSEVIASVLGAAAGSEHSHANTQTINISTS